MKPNAKAQEQQTKQHQSTTPPPTTTTPGTTRRSSNVPAEHCKKKWARIHKHQTKKQQSNNQPTLTMGILYRIG